MLRPVNAVDVLHVRSHTHTHTERFWPVCAIRVLICYLLFFIVEIIFQQIYNNLATLRHLFSENPTTPPGWRQRGTKMSPGELHRQDRAHEANLRLEAENFRFLCVHYFHICFLFKKVFDHLMTIKITVSHPFLCLVCGLTFWALLGCNALMTQENTRKKIFNTAVIYFHHYGSQLRKGFLTEMYCYT